ncbi:HAD-IIB family hydrolase [Leptotrichia sp. OH3620_COT-345]|uniref:HAD-IIB family hydrolase n=1 Tax=Leptotrichia sp. OH3620_COT-345 TaxID=2491048 RepID=UPI000F64C072|nr:HAD-IIB family hydrolase [Leptotrichia sp. OH3620_COT-345]RRD40346.1 HAD-IIB family hydrolase [Leptotrichia sp. OH3620_COT-345]
MKYLFCDLDNTLIFNNKIKKNDILAIQKWKKLGNDFIITTGRSFLGVKNILENYLKIDYKYIILNNGALIYKNNKKIYEKKLDSEIVFQILNEFIEDRNVYMRFDDNGINTLVTSEIESKNNINHIDKVIYKENLSLKGKEIYMLTIFNKSKKEIDAKKIEKTIKKRYNNILEVKMNKYAVDITFKGISKGNAICEILKYENIDKNDIYTLGDSFNDISMFKLNNNCFTLKTASFFIRKQVNYIVNNVEECIIDILENNI